MLVLLLGALAWLLSCWSHSALLAGAGALLILFGYALFLAAQFILSRIVSKGESIPSPSFAMQLNAWIGEVRIVPRVFGWRQPFWPRQVPDHLAVVLKGRRGVIFVHGFFCNRGFWTPWLEKVGASGRAFVAVDLEPVFGSIDSYAPIIDDAVRRVTEATDMPPILVCHSMGGLAVRAWLRSEGDESRIHRVITIGTPHNGTWPGRFSPTLNGRQMSLSSDWLLELARDEGHGRYANFTCWYSNCDNIVFPAETAMLPGADNRFLSGVAHVALAFHPEVMAASLKIIDT